MYIGQPMTMSDIANAFGRSRAWAHKRLQRGDFPNAVKVRMLYLVPPSDVLELASRIGRTLDLSS